MCGIIVCQGRVIFGNKLLYDIVAKCDILLDSFHGKGLRLGKNPLEKLNMHSDLERISSLPFKSSDFIL